LVGGVSLWLGAAENGSEFQEEHFGPEPPPETKAVVTTTNNETDLSLVDELDATPEDTLWDDASDVSPESVRRKAATLNTETQLFFAPDSSMSPTKATP